MNKNEIQREERAWVGTHTHEAALNDVKDWKVLVIAHSLSSMMLIMGFSKSHSDFIGSLSRFHPHLCEIYAAAAAVNALHTKWEERVWVVSEEINNFYLLVGQAISSNGSLLEGCEIFEE